MAGREGRGYCGRYLLRKGRRPRNYRINFADAEVAVFRISFLIKLVFIRVKANERTNNGGGRGGDEYKMHILIYF